MTQAHELPALVKVEEAAKLPRIGRDTGLRDGAHTPDPIDQP